MLSSWLPEFGVSISHHLNRTWLFCNPTFYNIISSIEIDSVQMLGRYDDGWVNRVLLKDRGLMKK